MKSRTVLTFPVLFLVAGEKVSGKKKMCLYAMSCQARGTISRKLKLPELEVQIKVNIHCSLESKHSQFLSVSACFKLQIPSCFFEGSWCLEFLFHFVLERAFGWESEQLVSSLFCQKLISDLGFHFFRFQFPYLENGEMLRLDHCSSDCGGKKAIQ